MAVAFLRRRGQRPRGGRLGLMIWCCGGLGRAGAGPAVGYFAGVGELEVE